LAPAQNYPVQALIAANFSEGIHAIYPAGHNAVLSLQNNSRGGDTFSA
jgi:hypothetical protein